MTSRGAALIKLLSDPRARLRAQIEDLREHTTSDSIRLVAKLEDHSIRALVTEAQALLEVEGTLTPYNRVDPKVITRDLDSARDTEITRAEIVSWTRDHKVDILKRYTFRRLDWLWDFSWTYLLWGMKPFKKQHLVLYGGIRGEPPEGLHRVPFQSVLNKLRKDIINRRDREIYLASKRSDMPALVALGLTPDRARQAIDFVRENGNGRTD